MNFTNRSDFINAAASDKIILAHIHGNKRVINWTLHSGSVYKRTLPYFVLALKKETTDLTRVDNLVDVVAGTFFYEINSRTVYTQLVDSSNPVDSEMIVNYRLFFSNKSFSGAWDLTDTGEHVHYEGRIVKNPEYNHQVGIDQNLSSVVGKGKLSLQNIDGELDDIYESLIYENQDVYIYNWNDQIPVSETQVIYRGKITNKFYTNSNIEFTVKDQLFNLLQTIPQSAFDDSDSVNDSVKGNVKRWIYGRVDGLKLQSVSQTGNGYDLTGTVSGATNTPTLTGVGTSFLSELSPGDKIIVESQELDIDDVLSDTTVTLSDNPSYAFGGKVAQVVPDISPVTKNRTHFVAGHATAKLTKTVVSSVQFNRVVLNNTDGLGPGDFVEFADTSERIEIKNVAPGNIIVLRQNMITLPGVGTDVTRQPVQRVYIDGVKVPSTSFSISNTSTDTKITFDSDVEFDLASDKNINFDLTFTNGTRTITTAENIDLSTFFQSRDWIRPSNIAYTTFYEVLTVNSQSMTIRTSFSDATHTGTVTTRRPSYIQDNTVVSADVLGRTLDNTPSGTWIQTGADVVKDVLSSISITNIDTQSFIDASSDADHLISMAIPATPSSQLTKSKEVIDKINKSILGTLTLNNDLDLRYKVLLVESPTNFVTIEDSDVKSFSIKSTNGKAYRHSIVQYRHQDIVRSTLDSGVLTKTYTSDFVAKYIGTNDTHTIDTYLYNVQSAEIISHRDIYYNQLSQSTITIKSDLRLEALEMGQAVILNFARLYKRYGDSATRKKVAYITGKRVDGKQITLILSDLGNIFNQTAIIAPNDTNDYSSATTDEKLKYGFITDNNGIVDDIEDTANTNLIT